MRHMDRPKIDGIVDYIKAAYPDSWRDYVLCRAGTEEPIAVIKTVVKPLVSTTGI